MALGAQNPQIKRLRRLVGRRSSRREENAFVVEGPTLVAEALGVGLDVECVFIGEDAEPPAGLGPSTPTVVVDRGVLERVLSPSSPQPVAAVIPGPLTRPVDTVIDTVVDHAGSAIVLVDVSDPGNVGTIIRSAEAAGCDAVLLAGSTADLTNPKTLRASAGSALRLPVAADPSIDDVLRTLSERRVLVLASVARNGVSHRRLPPDRPVAMVMGSEARGLPDEIVSGCDERVTIEMAGPTESLNVAMAATLLAFELQRGLADG